MSWTGLRGRLPTARKAADHKTSITLSIGENGRPQLDVDDRIEGRAPFIDVDGKMRYLSADSYVQTHFRAELTENGSLRLLEAPSFGFNLERDDFQKPYPPPTIELVEGLAADDALVQDVLQYANTNGIGASCIHAQGARCLRARTDPCQRQRCRRGQQTVLRSLHSLRFLLDGHPHPRK